MVPSKLGVALAVHDTHRAVVEQLVVELINRSLGVVRIDEVNVRVAQRAASHGVATNAHRRNCTDRAKLFIQDTLNNVGTKVADVQRQLA